MTPGDAWPGEEEETAVKPALVPHVRAEGRAEVIRKKATVQGELQTLALLEVSAAIDRLALIVKDGLRGLPPR